MQIKNLRIENYKLFQNLELVFDGRRTILFGINGSGKSAVLSAITQLFRVFLKQMNPAQSKAFESLQDEMIHIDGDRLEIQATVALEEEYLLSRFYRRTVKNTRTSEATYPKADYAKFRENFRKLYLADELSGMPVFVCYGTNRAVPDIPDRIRTTHQYDQLSALERAADPKTDFRAFFEWFMDREADEILRMKDAEDYEYTDPALQCVRKAIESVMGDVKGLRVKRSPVRMVVDKGGREIRVDLLSEGEKCTLAMIGDLAICGTRGWNCPGTEGFGEHDQKIYARELLRLRASLEDGKKRGAKEIIGVLHYPPTNDKHQVSGFTELMSEYGVKTCVYGHLHGKEKFRRGIKGVLNGVEYKLVSLDYLDARPLRLI